MIVRHTKHPRMSHVTIAEALRDRIVKGELASGSRLPNRRDLVRQFQASSVTVQRAVDRLIKEGFIYTDGPNGTFVTPHPPHTSRYGLLLTSHPSHHQTWRRFASVLCNAARDLNPLPGRTIAIYYDIDGKTQTDDYHRLLDDLRSHRLAGLIIAGEPDRLFGTPVLDERAPPRVALMEEPAGPGTPVVGHDRYTFIDKSLDYLEQRGRKSIAFIGGERISPANLQQYLTSALTARGMHHEPYWWQQVFVGEPELVRNLTYLLMHEDQTKLPDGLIIQDDNLVEYVIAGLMHAGVRVPQMLDLVTHCNFPWPSPTAVPLKRIGYDAKQTLELCVDLIDRQRAGETVEIMTQIKPVDEQELDSTARRAPSLQTQEEPASTY